MIRIEEQGDGPVAAIISVPGEDTPKKLADRLAQMVADHAGKFPDGYWFELQQPDKILVMHSCDVDGECDCFEED